MSDLSLCVARATRNNDGGMLNNIFQKNRPDVEKAIDLTTCAKAAVAENNTKCDELFNKISPTLTAYHSGAVKDAITLRDLISQTRAFCSTVEDQVNNGSF